MRPRAAVFCLHDIVPRRAPRRGRGDAPAVRPLAGGVPRASDGGAHRRPEHDHRRDGFPNELGGALLLPHLRRRLRQRLHRGIPRADASSACAPPSSSCRRWWIRPGYVTWAQLREMAAAGMEIGSHSLTHPFLHDAGRRRASAASSASRSASSRIGSVRPFAARRCRAAGSRRDFESVLDELGLPRSSAPAGVGWWHPGDSPAGDARASRCGAGWQPEDFAAIADGGAALALAPAGGRSREERGQGVPRPRRLAAPARAAAGAPGAACDARRCHSIGALAVIAWVYVGYPVVLGSGGDAAPASGAPARGAPDGLADHLRVQRGARHPPQARGDPRLRLPGRSARGDRRVGRLDRPHRRHRAGVRAPRRASGCCGSRGVAARRWRRTPRCRRPAARSSCSRTSRPSTRPAPSARWSRTSPTPRSAASAATCTTRRTRTTPRRRAARSSGATSASCASGRARSTRSSAWPAASTPCDASSTGRSTPARSATSSSPAA